jgi:hypothetical protein
VGWAGGAAGSSAIGIPPLGIPPLGIPPLNIPPLNRMMSVMKANSARRAEKALGEILDKADDNANGRVRLKDFIEILDANDVKVTQINVPRV